MHTFIGIDGCKSGWIVAIVEMYSATKKATVQLKKVDSIYEFEIEFLINNDTLVWIDIPVGLSETEPRLCDTLLRKELGKKGSSVFSTPVKSAVYADSYHQAGVLNFVATGKKISLQSWNICPKIKEIDVFLTQKPTYKPRFFESHPETLFHLAQPNYFDSKKTPMGFQQRVDWLKQFIPNLSEEINIFKTQFKRSTYNQDDLVDAVILAYSNGIAYHNSLDFLGDDDFRIYFPKQFP